MLPFVSHAQGLTFNKVMTYYNSGDEELILNDLRQKKFVIQKEQKSKAQLFDTQINCFKPSGKDYKNMYGIVIFKNANQITGISYFTFSDTDFQNKLKEIYKRGFKQTVENPTSHWIFESKDILVTVEKRDVTLSNKIVSRYEISVMKYQ